MALLLANRVQETATANTTVSFTLTGAVSGFQTFATIGDTNTTYYSATDASGNWEVGLGTYSTTGPTLTRTTVYASSNAGSPVTFSGTVNVFVTYPSGRSVNLDASGNVSALGTVSSGTWQGSTIGVAYGGTGQTTFTDGQLLIGNTTGNTLTKTTLTAGANITITNGAGAITIAASGGAPACATPTAAGIVYGKTTNAAFCGGRTSLGYNANPSYSGIAIGQNANDTSVLGQNILIGNSTDSNIMACSAIVIGSNAQVSTSALGAIAIGVGVNATAGGLFIAPVRNSVGAGGSPVGLGYCTTTKEILYGVGLSGTVALANGGTGQTTQQAALNALSGTQTANRVLRSDGTNVTLSQVALATDVSGTLPVANGGTGQTTYTNGQLLIGNSTGNTLTKATLTAGANITITNAAGAITIAASGGGGGSPATPTVAGIVYGRTQTACCGGRISLGYNTNIASQSSYSIVIGFCAGAGTACCAANCSVAIGTNATSFGFCGTAVGPYADATAYGTAIGSSANALGCGNSVAVGFGAGAECGSLSLGALTCGLCGCRTFIGPIRSATATYTLKYNPCTREVTYI